MQKKAEILAPAGNMTALRAAVANGANAIYLGVSDFNARRNAENFEEKDLPAVCDFCHKRAVKVYVTVNILARDIEMEKIVSLARCINRAGVDAVIVADLGVARAFREVAPELALHASTQMTVHNLDGVIGLYELGFKRAVLAREMTREEIRALCKKSPIELEVFVHGALCMCYSGQCEMSAIIGRRSGNRGLCAQPCRMQYKLGESAGSAYALSLRDLCLVDYITELSEMGVASLKIEGRMKRAEYVATVTGVYSRVLREGRAATDKEKKLLEDIFSREGFTDGYYTGRLGRDMFGIRRETEAPEKLLSAARRTYEGEIPEVREPVDFICMIEAGKPALLAASDGNGNRVLSQGAIPERARNVPLTEEKVRAQLEKTGATRFEVRNLSIKIAEGMSLPLSELNALRRDCLEQLERIVGGGKMRREGDFNVGFKLVNRKDKPRYTISVQSISQISDELLSRDFEHIIIPICLVPENEDRIREISEKRAVAVSLPRIIKDTEKAEIENALSAARALGIESVYVGNTGHIEMAKRKGFENIRADFGINIANSYALREVRRMGATSALLSPELTFPQIRGISKIIDTELIVYGRLPLMICENCVVQAQTGVCACRNKNSLTDRTGASFPLVPEFGHRTVILNSQKLFLADKKTDYQNVGIAYARLSFTTENARECVSVFDAYAKNEAFAPIEFTRGLYYRGVE